MEPSFVLDLRDAATGKQVAVELSRDEALLPLGTLLDGVLHATPEDLVARGKIASQHANTFFRLQDLIYPVDACGALQKGPYPGLIWRQRDGAPLTPERPALFERVRRWDAPDVLLLPLEVDRQELRYERTWRGFHTRRFARFRAVAEGLLAGVLSGDFGLDGPASERRLVEGAARRIWEADFENYSRFLAPAIRLKTGDETVASIAGGWGGVCTEKVLALKYLTDAYGIESQIVFAGPHTRAPLPLSELRAMLDELDSYDFTYARRYMRYWDHVALEYRLSDGSRWLVDPSNGNTPFICDPSAPYLDDGNERRSVAVRMLAVEEPVTYHRVPESLGLDFLFAWETWIADVDLMQVFDNHLGLLVGREFHVTAAVWGSQTKRAVAIAGWRRYAAEHGLRLGLTEADGLRVSGAERCTMAAFAAQMSQQARDCAAALPGLVWRYREHILVRYGIDKLWGADLVVLDRRPLLARLGSEAGS
ncbi:MAG: hypothetical protein AB7R89_14810 [Dehalococcoidia bacterium]